MGDIGPGNGLTIKQLLHTLREHVMSILQHKPPDLTLEAAQEYEKGISDVLVRARYLVNTFHITVRVPPEVLSMVCSHLAAEEDVFSASQVCRHWREVLISSPPLWTHFPCRSVPRTILSLERCKSMPVRLGFDRPSLNVALEKVLLHGNKIISLTLNHRLDQIPSLHQLFMFSRQSVERLHLRPQKRIGWRPTSQKPHEIWRDLPSLRELFVCQYTIPVAHFNAPNLAHLALQEPGYERALAVESILGILRGCPLLETLLISSSRVEQQPTGDHRPVSLPCLRSIELGIDEVRSGLVPHLRLSPDIAVGFRDLSPVELCGDVPSAIVAMQHVLGRFDIRCITLIVSSPPRGDLDLLIRFEGLQASLEITTYAGSPAVLWDTLFGQRGVLFSHSPRIGNVRELHIGGCPFFGGQDLRRVGAAMPNLVSISFFHCEDPHVILLPSHTNRPSPPFPRLERIMILGPESGLRGVLKTRKECGVPLKTLVVGWESGNGPANDGLEDYASLGEFVENLHIGCPVEISEWGIENEVLNLWSNIDVPSPSLLTATSGLFGFWRFNVPVEAEWRR